MSKARMMRCKGESGRIDCKDCSFRKSHTHRKTKREPFSHCGNLYRVTPVCVPVKKRKVPSDKEMFKIALQALKEIKCLDYSYIHEARFLQPFTIADNALSNIRSAMKEQNNGK